MKTKTNGRRPPPTTHLALRAACGRHTDKNKLTLEGRPSPHPQ